MADTNHSSSSLRGGATSRKALNHKDTKAQRKPFLFVHASQAKLCVFVVPFLSGPFATTSDLEVCH